MRTLQNVKPTPEQLPILADPRSGFRLIRGAAGSGKTTAALLRLRQLCASRLNRQSRLGSREPVRVLVLAFNRTLRGYVSQLATDQVSASDGLSLTIATFGHWAWHLVGQRCLINSREWIRELLLNTGLPPAASLEYFIDEVEYIIGRFLPDERNSYIRASRLGRGRTPVVSQEMRAKLLADVVEPYEAKKSGTGSVDWNDMALAVAAAPSEDYDIVVVDESQDFSANQIRAILAHLKKDHVTTFIIDAVQRIYPQSFQWRELGIEMRPEMVFTLPRNHRNTEEVARFALSLVEGLPPEEDGVLPAGVACLRIGTRPKIVAGIYSAQLRYMLDHVQSSLDAGETVAILQTKGGKWFKYAKRVLRRRGIRYCELTRNADWPSGPEQVALSTIHSAKGLEFDHVLMPGLNREVTPHGQEDGDGTLDSLRRLVAMGIGRARHTVMMGYKPGEKSALIELIDPETYDFVEI